MRVAATRRGWLGALCAAVLVFGAAPPAAQAAFDDPIFTYRPKPAPPLPPTPPPSATFEGPCGLAVNAAGDFYVSDYYHHTVDRFSSGLEYSAQLAGVDPLDGPCGLALDNGGRLYVNNFHRNVVRFTTSPFDAGTVIDSNHPTGVAVNPANGVVYVNDRTHVSSYGPTGTPLGEIGSFGDGYGLAVSTFAATKGFIYVPDAASETVKVYDPLTSATEPVSTIDGHGTPNGHFTSLRDAVIAIDKASGQIYVSDTVAPEYAELSETVIEVFSAAGTYEGRLKYSIENALPPGLAVDNSATATQGRVYVTTGNSDHAAVVIYPPHAATIAAVPLTPLSLGASGGGGDSGSGTTLAAGSAAAAPVSATPHDASSAASATATATAAVVAKPPPQHARHHHRRAKRGRR
jgi:hypothetical protein